MNPRQLQQMAQQMQKQMAKIQEELGNAIVEGKAGSYVTVTMNGHRELQSIKLAPEVVDPEDVDTLQDLIVAAMPLIIERKKLVMVLLALGSNAEFKYSRYFQSAPFGPDSKGVLSHNFFEVAKTIKPEPKTVALVGADAEFSNNVLIGARENAKVSASNCRMRRSARWAWRSCSTRSRISVSATSPCNEATDCCATRWTCSANSAARYGTLQSEASRACATSLVCACRTCVRAVDSSAVRSRTSSSRRDAYAVWFARSASCARALSCCMCLRRWASASVKSNASSAEPIFKAPLANMTESR